MNSHLVEIESAVENDFIVGQMKIKNGKVTN